MRSLEMIAMMAMMAAAATSATTTTATGIMILNFFQETRIPVAALGATLVGARKWIQPDSDYGDFMYGIYICSPDHPRINTIWYSGRDSVCGVIVFGSLARLGLTEPTVTPYRAIGFRKITCVPVCICKCLFSYYIGMSRSYEV